MSIFNWDNIATNLQENALEDKKSYTKEVDTRFWKLARNENDEGGALIRFLVDPNITPFIKMTRRKLSRGKGYFIDEWSPASIGLPDPIEEKFIELWKAGEKETAKNLFGRTERYIMNIKVLKDPGNPDNEGKIFLYDMSKTLFDKLKSAMVQTEAMKALGEEPIDVFDPLTGHNFLIKAKRGSTGIITYEDSKFADKPTALYDSEEEALADIKENAYELKEFLQPEFYKSYDDLKDMVDRFFGEGKYAEDAKKTSETPETPETVDDVNDEDLVIKTGLEKVAEKEPAKEPEQEPEKEPEQEAPKTKKAPVKEPEPKSDSIDDDLDSLLEELG
jgi:hypothetical protein